MPNSVDAARSCYHQYQLPLPIGRAIVSPKPVKKLDVEAELKDCLERDLTFKGEKTLYATHNLHAFAAKFPPQLPRLFIEKLTNPSEWVLDPMVGSGTALVEALLAGRNSVGVDLDPLAVLIARVKASHIDFARCAESAGDVLKNAARNLPSRGKISACQLYAPAAVRFFEYWFEPGTIHELAALASEIERIHDPDTCAFLKVAFSSMIITKSGGITRARDLAHSRPHRDPNKKIQDATFEAFAERVRVCLRSLESLAGAQGSALVARGDTRSLPLRNNSVHLIVTSPPYAANAIDYVRAHKFSLMWFHHSPGDLSELRRRYIGAELQEDRLTFTSATANRVLHELASRDRRKAAVIAHYFRTMEDALREMFRVLQRHRAAVLVVGSSTIRGLDIKAPTVLAELATGVGFRLGGVARREIIRDARMMPVSKRSERNGIEARMHEEGVIGLLKP